MRDNPTFASLLAASAATLAIVALLFARLLSPPAILRNGRPLRFPPHTLPVLGNALVFLRPRLAIFSFFSLCERHHCSGRETLQLHVPTVPPAVLVHDPASIDALFRSPAFAKGEFVRDRSWDLFGHGIVNAEGPLWRAQRRAGLAFLSAANLRVLTEVTLPEHLRRAVAALRTVADSGGSVDMQDVFLDITTGLMGTMAYNMDMSMSSARQFTEAFDRASGVTAERFQNPLWRVKELLLLAVPGGGMRGALKVVKKFSAEIVAKAVAERNDGKAAPGVSDDGNAPGDDHVSGTLIHSLLDALSDETTTADAALNYLSAGRDTTAQALTWAFYLLSDHAAVLDKLRREALAALDASRLAAGHRSESTSVAASAAAAADGMGLDPTVFTPAAVPYAAAVFYETLRLHPPIPLEIRQAQEPTTLADGTALPRGAVVVWCPWSMGRSRTTWGDDADEFRPERWLADGKLVSHGQGEYPVFNGGARLCLGKRMAELVVVQAMVTVALLFDLEPVVRGARASGSSMTLPMEGGFVCRASRRSAGHDQVTW